MKTFRIWSPESQGHCNWSCPFYCGRGFDPTYSPISTGHHIKCNYEEDNKNEIKNIIDDPCDCDDLILITDNQEKEIIEKYYYDSEVKDYILNDDGFEIVNEIANQAINSDIAFEIIDNYYKNIGSENGKKII